MTEPPSESGDAWTCDASDSATAPAEAGQPSRVATLRDQFKRSEVQLEARYGELETRRGESAPMDVAFRVVEADRRYTGGLIS